MALTQKFDLRPKIGLIWEANKPRRGKRREEEEEEEEEKKRRREIKQKGMKYNFGYGFLLWNSKVCMNFHAIGWLLVVPKPRDC